MHLQSLLIHSKNSSTGLEFAKNFLKQKGVSNFDITLISEEKTIGIGDIRSFQSKIFLKPSQGKEKGIIIDSTNGITTEAQNSLLKVLEEPPNNTYIMLVTSNKEIFLPTILSRCKLIELENKESTDLDKFKETLNDLSKKGIGERLKLAQDFSKDKNQAITFIENLILTAREDMKKNLDHSQENSLILKKLQAGYLVIKITNANLRLALENIFLSL